MNCPNCGSENRPDGKFCSECGTPLARACGSCGNALRPDAKFCDECGTAVDGVAPKASVIAEAPSAERRLVSVLFADLVGFTTLSESRDAEEVRELLSRYFDTCRQIVSRYGGTVEKFIGDAVMAVWGTPVAQEDDAERAVRAALELTKAVVALGEEVGAADLRARAGVLTGEAAVTIGAEGEGMVAGDLVNTASRVQSVAEPGQVLVGETTIRVAQASIAYEEAGVHELKGKGEPVPLWRALRVVAGVGGALKSERLEAPFVGRERELRMVKELFHASSEEGKAHLVSIVGIAGIGKSRLAWEFYKYFDGLRKLFRWHRGRCLAYGEGVTYWALAEMVRGRAGIEESEDKASARAKLRAAVEEYVSDPEERTWIEPRLAHLLALEEREARERADLFAGWRLFFERIAERDPVVMAFEDMQWADAALLDFVEYLLEWSRNLPIFIITMARPELLERRPSWGAGKRNFTSLFLEPLPAQDMRELLGGLAPGLPEEIQVKILDRAEGVPLYAVETVRMLLDRGALVEEGNAYRLVGEIETLDVPESLHALIAARLDGLSADERRLLQDASVLGKTFTREGIAALTGKPEGELEQLLSSLVRKEVLGVQADPRSPERGQFGFLQDLVKRVAYETLSKRDRRDRHLAVGAVLEERLRSGEDDLIEVIASHYVDAYQAMPDVKDGSDIKEKARDTLTRAGERAASLAAADAGERYFSQASELADDASTRAKLRERAGVMALIVGSNEQAKQHLQMAMDLFEQEGLNHDAARVSARMGEADWMDGRLEDAIERMEKALPLLSTEDPDEGLATLLAQLARLHYFKGNIDMASERIEEALAIAEPMWFPSVVAHGLVTKALVLEARSRPEESTALMKHGLELALEHDELDAAGRACNNLATFLFPRGQIEAAKEYASQGHALALKLGSGSQARFVGAKLVYIAMHIGDWDRALGLIEELFEGETPEEPASLVFLHASFIHLQRGDFAGAGEWLSKVAWVEGSENVDWQIGYSVGRAQILIAEGNAREALGVARDALDKARAVAPSSLGAGEGFVEAVEAAIRSGEFDIAEETLNMAESLRPGEAGPIIRAFAARFRAGLLAARGKDDAVEPKFEEASGLFRELGFLFWLAVVLLEYGEWLTGLGRVEEATPLLDEAREIFERLKARPWLERLEKLLPEREVARA